MKNKIIKKYKIIKILYEDINNKFTNIRTEIINLFKEKMYNTGKSPNSISNYNNKEVKHFPKRKYLSVENVKKIFIKNNKSVSITLLNNSIDDMNIYILNTIDRRINGFKSFYNINNRKILEILWMIENKYDIEFGLSLRNDIHKYQGDEIKIVFPEFYNIKNDRIMFDIIYSIKTENIHSFIYMENNKQYLCELILICVMNDKYNILFQSLKKYEIINESFEYLYNNIN